MAEATPDGRPNGGVDRTSDGEAGIRHAIFLALLAPFTLLTFLAVSSGSPSDVRQRPRLLTTMATITGPFTGAVARNGQSCCLAFSVKLAAWLAPALAIGVLAQFLPFGPAPTGRGLRLALWGVGWFLWLAGGPASFLHAFS